MKDLIFKNHEDWAGVIARITIGLIILPHGAQKLLGIFGGFGFDATMSFFTTTMQLPWIIGFLVILIEFFGSIFLIMGFTSRIWALCMIVLMLGIIFTSHLDNGFFMNWLGNQKGEGFEYHLLIIGLSLIVTIHGSGKYAVDNMFYQK
ncbi:hypothetical protein AD998_16210 [bacterium 336/3]|nr:hypothetical protein AD998_16210 [bacterium 336/3]